MNHKIIVFAVLFSVALSGCGGSSSTNPANTEIISGVAVPPEPDEKENNKTIAGIDANSDGIRDDVERRIAKDFGRDKEKHNKALKLALSEQLLLANPKNNTDKYIKTLDCLVTAKKMTVQEMNSITHKTFNTKERSHIYRSSMVNADNIEGVDSDYCK